MHRPRQRVALKNPNAYLNRSLASPQKHGSDKISASPPLPSRFSSSPNRARLRIALSHPGWSTLCVRSIDGEQREGWSSLCLSWVPSEVQCTLEDITTSRFHRGTKWSTSPCREGNLTNETRLDVTTPDVPGLTYVVRQHPSTANLCPLLSEAYAESNNRHRSRRPYEVTDTLCSILLGRYCCEAFFDRGASPISPYSNCPERTQWTIYVPSLPKTLP